MRNWALSCPWAPEIPGTHVGQGRFWPFIKGTNITKQYLDFTMTWTSCKTWSWLLSASCPWGLLLLLLLLLLFSFFSICGAQNVFQEQILLDTSRADSSMDELALKSLLRKSLNHPEESRISGICSKSHFLLKEIVLFEENIFCIFFSDLSDFERIIFMINPSVSKAERFCLQMSLSWYQFLCNSSPTWAFSSQQWVQWVLCPFLLKVKGMPLKFRFEPYIIEFPFPRNASCF